MAISHWQQDAIIGVECALGLQGYTSFDSYNFPIYLYDGNGYYVGNPTIIGVGKLGLPNKNELVIKNNLKMTNPYRSIIDIMHTNTYSEFSVTAVAEMLNDENKMKILEEYAKRYGLAKELKELIEEAENWEF